MMAIELDVIVRTLADTARAKQLFRALDSIQDQAGIHARPIVVVNGQAYDRSTLSSLEQRPGIVLHYLQPASAGRARAAGYRRATAPFLSFLDDDDTFIDGALQRPLQWLTEHPQCDVVITNGYFISRNGEKTQSTHISNHVDNPGLSLLDENWLSPGASFFRNQSIGPEYFRVALDHHEWTQLAFELCAGHKRLHFMDIPTVLYHDTPGSMSKQFQHRESELVLLRQVRSDSRLDAAVRGKANRKYCNVQHILAMEYWKQGSYGRAWRSHLASMRPPYIFKYLLSSRKLLWPFKMPRPPGASMPEHPED